MNKALIIIKLMASALAGLLVLSMAACSGNTDTSESVEATQAAVATVDEATHPVASTTSASTEATAKNLAEADITINETIENSADGEHAVTADGESASYSNTKVVKTGDSTQNDEADFYGDNAAIFAANGATLNLSEMVVKTDGKHANAVFSYGEGTTVNSIGDAGDVYVELSGGSKWTLTADSYITSLTCDVDSIELNGHGGDKPGNDHNVNDTPPAKPD